MPVVCVNRPNRSEIRHFTPRDLQRIARYVNQGGAPWVTIIASVLIVAGAGVLVCRLSAAIDRTLGILGIIRQIAAILASAAAINAAIVWLSRARRVPIPVITNILGWLLVLLLAIRALASGAAGLASDLETVEDIAGTLRDWCAAIKLVG